MMKINIGYFCAENKYLLSNIFLSQLNYSILIIFVICTFQLKVSSKNVC